MAMKAVYHSRCSAGMIEIYNLRLGWICCFTSSYAVHSSYPDLMLAEFLELLLKRLDNISLCSEACSNNSM